MSCPKNTRILTVDDSVALLGLLKAQLASLGYKDVVIAKSGIEAVKILADSATNRIPIQLIISDWNMPELSGQDLLKLVRAMPTYAKVPFLMLTAEKDREKILLAAAAGISGYLIKPLEPAVLQTKLDQAWKP